MYVEVFSKKCKVPISFFFFFNDFVDAVPVPPEETTGDSSASEEHPSRSRGK